jgi:hypothetical protein
LSQPILRQSCFAALSLAPVPLFMNLVLVAFVVLRSARGFYEILIASFSCCFNFTGLSLARISRPRDASAGSLVLRVVFNKYILGQLSSRSWPLQISREFPELIFWLVFL